MPAIFVPSISSANTTKKMSLSSKFDQGNVERSSNPAPNPSWHIPPFPFPKLQLPRPPFKKLAHTFNEVEDNQRDKRDVKKQYIQAANEQK